MSSSEETNEIHLPDLYGKSLNNYLLLYKLGSGSYSDVYLAYKPRTDKFYAIKIISKEDKSTYKEEINILRKIKNIDYMINLKDAFIEKIVTDEGKKDIFYCLVFNLFAGNLDDFIRKGYYHDGFDDEVVEKISIQILTGLKHMHKKMKCYHADLKTDNILLKGYNKKDEHTIKLYRSHSLFKTFSNNKHLTDGDKINHKKIAEDIEDKIEGDKYDVSDEYIKNAEIVISDFGNFCGFDEEYTDSFGTRYYRAPENILIGRCNEKTDIWSFGCILYELTTGRYLFDPEKNRFDTNHQHLVEMSDMFGPIPYIVVNKAKLKKKYFHGGELKSYKWKKNSVFDELCQKYSVDDKFKQTIRSALKLDPNKRKGCSELLEFLT